MFDKHAWESRSFDFTLNGIRFFKSRGTPDWMVNDVEYEYEYGEDATPALITTILDGAPQLVD